MSRRNAITSSSDTGNGASQEVATKPLISIVVPVFNEQDNVERTYAELCNCVGALTEYSFEFIFTDNHSTDETFGKLTSLAAVDPRIRIARFARNFGFQKSVMTGYRLARGAAAIQIDADLQDPPAMIGPFLQKWREGYDVVVGVRRRRPEGWLLQAGRRAYYRLMRRLDGEHLIPDAGDFRLIDRSVIDRLRRINEPHMYLRGMISAMGRRQIGLPYDRAERRHNESKYGLWPLAKLALDGILSHSSLPLRLSFYVGLTIAVLAAILAVFYLLVHVIWPASGPPGFTTTQLLILSGIAMNSLFLGVLGIYVGRIYDQVRVRPLTIIADLVNFEEPIDLVEHRLNHSAEAFRIVAPARVE